MDDVHKSCMDPNHVMELEDIFLQAMARQKDPEGKPEPEITVDKDGIPSDVMAFYNNMKDERGVRRDRSPSIRQLEARKKALTRELKRRHVW